jgi:glycerol kinase
VYATEPTNASRTMLFDIDSLSWCAELCDLFGVPMAALPQVRPSAGDFGWTTKEMLGAEIPITGIAGDQQAALFGQGCWNAGQGKNTYGTGAFLLLNTGRQRPRSGEGLLTTVACDASGKPAYALEAAIFIAGAAVQWLRDGLGIIAEAAETETLARSLTGNDGVYFVPALVGLGAPAWEPRARGTIVGLTRGTGRAHFARAALEAMSYSTVDVTNTMSKMSGVPCQRLRVDGGATQNDWLMQHQADMLGVPVERPDIIETTALGAAGLAGIAGGVWSDAKAFQSKREYTVFAPKRGRTEAQRDIEGWQRAVRAALGWARDTQ